MNEASPNESSSGKPVSAASGSPPPVQAKLVQAQPVQAPTPRPPQSEGLYQQVLHSRLAILATLFCVTGFLGLPLLWMNPYFTRLQRWLWAIVVTIYTFILIGVVCWVVVWSWNSISESL